MDKQFTASEVRDLSRRMAVSLVEMDARPPKDEHVMAALDAFADLLEAQEKAVPAVDGWTTGFCGGRRVSLASVGRDPEVRKKLMDLLDFMNKMESTQNQPTEDTSPPKYDPRHTAPSDAERLAEALRAIRERVTENSSALARFIIATCDEALTAHSAQAQPPAASVPDAMVGRALYARVPGGAQVWHWLPDEYGKHPHPTAYTIMRAALEAALAAQETKA